jgi:hypothetical protein
LIRATLADIGDRVREVGLTRTALFMVGRRLVRPQQASKLYDGRSTTISPRSTDERRDGLGNEGRAWRAIDIGWPLALVPMRHRCPDKRFSASVLARSLRCIAG